jgi:FkbM family methyltransferase
VNIQSELEALLEEGVTAAVEREQTTFDRLADPFQDSLVLFGARRLGRKTLDGLRKAGVEPVAFSDNDPATWNTMIDGVPVLPPADAASRFGRSAAFVITIWGLTPKQTLLECERQLRDLGCRTVVPLLPLLWKYAGIFLPDLFRDLPHKVHEDAGALRDAMAVLSDDRSKAELLAQVRWRLFGDFGSLTDPVEEPIYFPSSVGALTSEEVFVDCGAYDGDTLKVFLNLCGGRFEKIIAFEPDPNNRARLRQTIAGFPEAVRRRIGIRPEATGAYSRPVKFAATGTVGARIGQGDFEVDCVTLDDALRDEAPTYIKMDIEGAEPEALAGARRILAERAPVLAVCSYHVQNHCWRIPLQIQRTNPEYRIFLRQHIQYVEDLVCYAIPPGRCRD